MFFDMKKLCGEQFCLRRAIKKELYSIGTSYSKQVIYLPPPHRETGTIREIVSLCADDAVSMLSITALISKSS